MTQIAIAVILVIAAIYFAISFVAYKRARSRKRTLKMLISQGVNPDVLKSGNQLAIAQDIRSRCSRCQAEDVCERWLKNPAGNNDFCPNAAVFERLKLI